MPCPPKPLHAFFDPDKTDKEYTDRVAKIQKIVEEIIDTAPSDSPAGQLRDQLNKLGVTLVFKSTKPGGEIITNGIKDFGVSHTYTGGGAPANTYEIVIDVPYAEGTEQSSAPKTLNTKLSTTHFHRDIVATVIHELGHVYSNMRFGNPPSTTDPSYNRSETHAMEWEAAYERWVANDYTEILDPPYFYLNYDGTYSDSHFKASDRHP